MSDAVADTDPARATEGVGRHRQQLERLRALEERVGVGLERLGPQVERPLRLDELVAERREPLGEGATVLGVGLHIGRLVDAVDHHALENGRSANEAQLAASAGDREHKLVVVRVRVGHEHPADALARQAEAL